MTDRFDLQLHSAAAGGDVECRVLTPPRWTVGEPLPLVVVLHGAMSSAASLDHYEPLLDGAWGAGLPRAIVACASTPTEHGFYIDWPDGGGWETVVRDELPALVADRFGADVGRLALLGASMGGYGALKLAFAEPGRYAAVAAIAPATFRSTDPTEVPEAERPSVLGLLLDALAALPAERLETRLATNAAHLRERDLPTMVVVGDHDEFRLHVGAEHLHARLVDLGIPHHFVRWQNGTHMGSASIPLMRAATEFVLGHLAVSGSGRP